MNSDNFVYADVLMCYGFEGKEPLCKPYILNDVLFKLDENHFISLKIHDISYNLLVEYMKVSELQRKDIVNINDGKIVGRIIDVLINEIDGTLDGFVIERSKYIRSLFSSEEDTIIKFNQIKKLGSDVILIDI